MFKDKKITNYRFLAQFRQQTAAVMGNARVSDHICPPCPFGTSLYLLRPKRRVSTRLHLVPQSRDLLLQVHHPIKIYSEQTNVHTFYLLQKS